MVEVTEERLHRKAGVEQRPGDTCALTCKAVGKGVPGRGSSVSKCTEASDSLCRVVGSASGPAHLKHSAPGLSKMGLGRESQDSEGRPVCSHRKNCNQGSVLVMFASEILIHFFGSWLMDEKW